MSVKTSQEKGTLKMAGGLKNNRVNVRDKQSKAPYLPYTLKVKKGAN